MASFIKRNGRWTARDRKKGYPEITQTFATKAQAQRTWNQTVQSDPDEFLITHSTTGSLLRHLGT